MRTRKASILASCALQEHIRALERGTARFVMKENTLAKVRRLAISVCREHTLQERAIQSALNAKRGRSPRDMVRRIASHVLQVRITRP